MVELPRQEILIRWVNYHISRSFLSLIGTETKQREIFVATHKKD
jgi:hypothetical protein